MEQSYSNNLIAMPSVFQCPSSLVYLDNTRLSIYLVLSKQKLQACFEFIIMLTHIMLRETTAN